MNEKQLCATAYALNGLEKHGYPVRVLRVLDAVPNDDLRPVRLQRWADSLWRTLKVPVFPRGDTTPPVFLVPASAPLEVNSVINIGRDVADCDFRAVVTDEVLSIDPENTSYGGRMLAAKMVERVITDRFLGLKAKYWKTQWNLFFRLQPENQRETRDEVNAFRGLHFSVFFLDGAHPYLATDIKTRYFGRYSLSQHDPARRLEFLADHLDPELKIEDRALFVRDNGVMKRSCRFVEATGKSVADYRITDLNNISVLDYYQKTYPNVALDAKDEAVLVRDHGNDRSLPVPASRLFPIFTTDDDELRGCSVEPHLSPRDRVRLIETFLADVGPLRLADREFLIAGEPLVKDRSVFPAPSLEFGQQNKLSTATQGIASADEDEAFARFRNAKLSSLYDFGPYSSQPLPDACLLFPETLNRGHREALVARLTEEVRRLTGHTLNFIKQKAYRLGSHARHGSGLLAEADSLTREQRGVVLAIVVLSDRFDGSVYGMLKGQLNGLPSQCVSERTVRRIATEERSQYASSRLRNLALGVITSAGIQPWVLAEPLRHDFYVGIDVLRNEVGYTFVYGQCGRRVRVDFGEFLHRIRQHEAIDRVEMRTKLESALRAARQVGAPLRSIVVHRDGRWWPSEEQGLQEAITILKRDGVLQADCRVAVVEIRKSHMPMRLLSKVRDELQNPMPGTYLTIDETQAILATTGKPGPWDKQRRTASTLLVRLTETSTGFDIREIAEDVYRLTHLNWSAPEIEISLPVTIRWNDDSLRYSLMKPTDELDSQEADEIPIPAGAAT